MSGQFINTGTNPNGKLSLVNNSNSGNFSLTIPQICFIGMQNVAGSNDNVGFFFGLTANIE